MSENKQSAKRCSGCGWLGLDATGPPNKPDGRQPLDDDGLCQVCRKVESEPILSGERIKRLMRQHKVTIRGLAQDMQITMKRVREVRERGVTGAAVQDWMEAITR